MSDDVKPALTAEEWKSPKVMFRAGKYDEGYGIELIPTGDRRYFVDGNTWAVVFDGSWAVAMADETRHRLAALALYGQLFGFTRDDVRLLRDSQIWADSTQLTSGGNPVDFDDLANRIAALLPPEDA